MIKNIEKSLCFILIIIVLLIGNCILQGDYNNYFDNDDDDEVEPTEGYIAPIEISYPTIDHWETIVVADQTWDYFIGTSEPSSNWKNLSFDSSSWSKDIAGFGYGDGDDNTIVPDGTISIYLRKHFIVVDLNAIELAILNIDFDDAFVAYINGTEIARENIGTEGTPPAYNDTADEPYEACLYDGGAPYNFQIAKEKLQECLNPGNNVLTIQVHNRNASSSDMSAIPYLSFGLNDTSNNYNPTPAWFEPPVYLQDSNLPIIIIDTDGAQIVDEPDIRAKMGIIYNGESQRNYITNQQNDYLGYINIEIRGQSSQMFPKKSYRVETQFSFGGNRNVPILGMPKENDWVLYAPYSDKTMMRNVLTYKMAREMGGYHTKTKYCELIINSEYKGVYVFMEKIKRDINRVNIDKLEPYENSGDSLTGGYILKVDKEDDDPPRWTSMPSPNYPSAKYISFQYVYPKPIYISSAQRTYIQNFILAFQNTLIGSNYQDPTNGYAKYIDVDSFIDFMIIHEITKEVDSYRYSTYMYKDKDNLGGKLTMGPNWDFNLGYGNVDYSADALDTAGWFFTDVQPSSWSIMYWWKRLAEDPAFVSKLQARWAELRSSTLSTSTLTAYIDATASELNESQTRNYNTWKILGTYIWPNYDYEDNTYQDEIDYLKTWLTARLTWIDANIGSL